MFRSVLIRSLLAAMALFSSHSVFAAPENGAKFKDWTVACEEVGEEGKKTQVCHLFQIFTAGEKKRPLLRVAVTYLPGEDSPYLVLTMPLGMALPPGVQLQIDDGEKQRIPVNTCLPDGCRAGGNMADAMIDALKKGSTLKISFADMNLKTATVPVSLSGFTAGLASLK
ncbi:MAG: invasion associated locus B family protein [Gammaproteobacteria bacterium]|nr:invasion associated locus B family protein [Gammaproteobacteria bacterium]MCP5138110.1 invasion associated locus B family protein [Gammaproteobacteria bacterium]